MNNYIHSMRKLINIVNESESVDEKWNKETKVSPKEKGKYEDWTLAELRKVYNALKASGPPLGNRKVTIVTADGGLIDGEEKYVLGIPYQSVTLICHDNSWWEI